MVKWPGAKEIMLIRLERSLLDQVKSLVDKLEYSPESTVQKWYDNAEAGALTVRVRNSEHEYMEDGW